MKNNIQKLNLFNTHVQRTYRVAGLFYVLLKYYLILACGICVLWQQWTNSHGLHKSCGEKGMPWPLSK